MSDLVALIIIFSCLWLAIVSLTLLPRLFKRGRHERERGRHKT